MATSYHDGNHTHTLLAVGTDGSTLRNVAGNPTTHAINISDGNTGSDNGPTVSVHDASQVPILMATSRTDGVTPIAIYADASNNLLTEST